MPVFAGTPYYNSALTATKAVVKASPGRILGCHISNVNANAMYVQMFDALTAGVTVGVTTPTNVLMVPGGSAAAPGGVDTAFGTDGLRYTTGIVIAATTTIGGAVAPGTGLTVNLFVGGS